MTATAGRRDMEVVLGLCALSNQLNPEVMYTSRSCLCHADEAAGRAGGQRDPALGTRDRPLLMLGQVALPIAAARAINAAITESWLRLAQRQRCGYHDDGHR